MIAGVPVACSDMAEAMRLVKASGKREWAAIGQFAMILASFLALTYAHVVSDFSVLNVVQNSHSMKPMLYKVAGVWGNHEGSMVLWVLILAMFGCAVALFGRNLPPTLKARVLSVQATVATAFFTSSSVCAVRPDR